MIEQWVVTYRVEHAGGMTVIEMYRGPKAECQRIAAHSAAPNTFEGHKVSAFRPIIGPAKDWEKFLKEAETAYE